MPATDAPLPEERAAYRARLLNDIEAGSVRCGVIGLGFIGSVLMDALTEAGLPARGFDRAAEAVARYTERHVACPAAADLRILHGCNVLFVAVRNLSDGSLIDEEPLQAAAHSIKRHTVRPCLVILETTVAPGTTRRFVEQIGGADDRALFVAHAPERLSAGQDHQHLRAIPHLVAGTDADATQLAAALLGKICDRVVTVSAPEVSEVSKLLENAFLSVNIGLTSEVTRLCSSLGIHAQEVCRAAATKPRGFMPFYPGAGLGGHCLPNDLLMFAQAARSRGWEPELLAAAITVNDRAPQLVVDRLQMLLVKSGIPLANSQILIVGVGFKAGAPDTTRSPAIEVVRMLRERRAVIAYVDPLNADFSVDEVPLARLSVDEVTRRRFAAGILWSGARDLPESALLEACGVVLDVGGSRVNRPPVDGIETL